MDLKAMAQPAAVLAPDSEDLAEQSSGSVDMQALAQLLSKANVVAKKPQSRGMIKMSDIPTGARASAKAARATESAVTKHVDDIGSLSEFSILMKDSGIASRLEDAAADGQKVTLFAPTNKAMSRLPGLGLSLMKRSPEHRDVRDNFVAQHAVFDFARQFASAKMSLDGMGAAIETLQDGAHISIQDVEDSDDQLAVQHNDEGAITSAARIQGTFYTPAGHTIHLLETPLA